MLFSSTLEQVDDFLPRGTAYQRVIMTRQNASTVWRVRMIVLQYTMYNIDVPIRYCLGSKKNTNGLKFHGYKLVQSNIPLVCYWIL